MSNSTNDILFEQALERLENSQKALWETIEKTLKFTESLGEQSMRLKVIENELKDLNGKIMGYFPPTDSTRDADYLKEVPEKLTNFNK